MSLSGARCDGGMGRLKSEARLLKERLGPALKSDRAKPTRRPAEAEGRTPLLQQGDRPASVPAPEEKVKQAP